MKNKFIKSKNYKGVFHYIKEGKKIYFYKYNYKHIVNDVEVISKKQKVVGCELDDITEKIAFLEKVKSQELLKKEAVIKKEAIPTLNEFAKQYFSITDAKSKKKMEQRYNKHIKDCNFAKTPINTNMRLSILQWRNNLLGTLSKNTINNLSKLINIIFHFAIDNNLDKGFFKNNPIPTYRCGFKKANVKREGWLSKDKVALLLNTVKSHKDKHLYLFVMIAVYTGARFQSILSIQKKDINFDKLFININNTKSERIYAVFLNEDLYPILHERASLLKNPNDYLFQDEGIRINALSFQERLLKILDKLFNQGLDKKDSVYRIVIHSLRHTCASLLAEEGASMSIIQKQLDHSSEAHTKVYAKVSPESVKKYAIKLNFSKD